MSIYIYVYIHTYIYIYRLTYIANYTQLSLSIHNIVLNMCISYENVVPHPPPPTKKKKEPPNTTTTFAQCRLLGLFVLNICTTYISSTLYCPLIVSRSPMPMMWAEAFPWHEPRNVPYWKLLAPKGHLSSRPMSQPMSWACLDHALAQITVMGMEQCMGNQMPINEQHISEYMYSPYTRFTGFDYDFSMSIKRLLLVLAIPIPSRLLGSLI